MKKNNYLENGKSKLGYKFYDKACFCGSKKRYKNCCKKKYSKLEDIMSILDENFELEHLKKCYIKKNLSKNCNNEIIKAHTISKSSNLDKLRGKNQKLVTFGISYQLLKNEKGIQYKKIPPKKASIFKGFCKYHDNKLFEDIDNNFNIREKKSFFLSFYRQTKYEYFKKNRIIENMKNISLFLKNTKFHHISLHFNKQIEQEKLSLNDLNDIIASLETSIDDNENYIENDLLYVTAFSLDSLLPFNFSAIYSPISDYEKKDIFYNPTTKKIVENIHIASLFNNGNPVFFLCCLKRHEKGVQFIKSFNCQKEKISLITKLAFCIENTFFQTEFIDNHINKDKFLSYFNEDTVYSLINQQSSSLMHLEPFDFDINVNSKIIETIILN